MAKKVEPPKPKISSTFRVHVSIQKRYPSLIQLIEPLPKDYGVRSDFCTQLMLDGLKYRELVNSGAINPTVFQNQVTQPMVTTPSAVPASDTNLEDDLVDALFGDIK